VTPDSVSTPAASEAPHRAWYRSLYWRIGIGLVSFLAAFLTLQALALVWLISRMEVAPGPPSPDITRLVSRELGDALASNTNIDLEKFLRDQYERRLPLVVVMRDGRVVSSDGRTLPEGTLSELRARMSASPESFLGMGRGRGDRDRNIGPRGFGPPPDPSMPRGPRGRGPGPPFFGGRMGRGGPPAPIVVNGQLVGVVVANPQSTFEQLGPTLLTVGLFLVGIGITAAALLIVGPVRRRIGSLEEAARKVGQGDLTARAREDGSDEVAALAHTFNNMTAALAAREAQLHAADRSRRLLLADVSHELMTPLTAMRGYLETVSMHNLALDPQTRDRYLSIINDETRRVEHIVQDLLDLARMESGGESLDVQDVPIEDLFGRVVARHGRDAEVRGVRLSTDIAPGAEIVSGDPMRLEQALQNLAANALRHTSRGGSVALTAVPGNKEVTLKVRDTGSGISPDHLAHVFDRFYKADPARPGESSGSGLGLSIVKAIIERHRGKISVASRPGEGTEFTVHIPA
jgi:two-component system OmpR family sensor kinase